MDYFSVCDGIGAAHTALLPLGYHCAGVSEIEKNCNQLVQQKYGFKNYGDFRNWRDFKTEAFSLVIGGSPCQSFSLLGSKRGFDDQRGGLTKDFIDFVCGYTPQWFIWENVPGIFSIDGGAPFRYFLSRFMQCGYGVAWRVLDAQFFGVPNAAAESSLSDILEAPSVPEKYYLTGQDCRYILEQRFVRKRTIKDPMLSILKRDASRER